MHYLLCTIFFKKSQIKKKKVKKKKNSSSKVIVLVSKFKKSFPSTKKKKKNVSLKEGSKVQDFCFISMTKIIILSYTSIYEIIKIVNSYPPSPSHIFAITQVSNLKFHLKSMNVLKVICFTFTATKKVKQS